MSVWVCDVNGVLVDSIAVVRRAFTATAARYGFAFDEAAFQRVKGIAVLEAYRLLDPGGDASRRREYHVHHVREHAGEIRAYPGAIEVLAEARRRGIVLGATSSHGETAERCLVDTGLYAYFDCLVTQDEVRRPKPSPEAILTVLRLLRRDERVRRREWIAHIGDTPLDVQAGKAAGIATVGVTYGVSPEAEIRRARPDRMIHTFTEMLAFLPAGEGRLTVEHATA